MSSSTGTTSTAPGPDTAMPLQPRAWPLRLAPWLACALAIAAVVYVTWNWNAWTGSRPIQSTQNAFVKSDPVILSARVSGYVRQLPVTDYQTVRAGDVIAEIESDAYAIGVRSAEAALAKARAVLANLDNEEAQQRAAIAQARASLRGREANLVEARRDYVRQSRLVEKGAVSRKSFDDAEAALASATASRDTEAAALGLTQRGLDTLSGQRAQLVADRDAAAASLALAKLDLHHTRIVAPFDGVLGRRDIQVGSLVGSGTEIITIVPRVPAYVIANYKETQLRNVQPGQPVEVIVDALPDHRFRGRVEQISPMSGNELSIVPTDNATGNFTKVVQRIPVRIELAPGQSGLDRLRAGMSVETRIDTQDARVAAYSRQRPEGADRAHADARQ